MQLPTWAVVLLSVLAGLGPIFGYALWSSRSQRFTRVGRKPLGSLEAAMPAIEALTQGWRVSGNSVELLRNGDGFFPRLLGDIRAARHSVHLETYLWWRGAICSELAGLLSEKAAEGVAVRLVVDAVGSWSMEEELLEKMRAAGVRVAKYHDFRFRTLGRINKRTHRKLAVVDARIGYVFAHGIADEWTGDAQGPDHWRDTGARLLGPIVPRVQALFAQHWMEETAEVLAEEDYFATPPEEGDVTLHLVASSPRGGVSQVSLLHRLVIAAANREIVIQNPYFSPSSEVVEMLAEAAGRGVRVRIMVPGEKTDSFTTWYSGHRRFERLLEAGVEIWEYGRTLPHQKVMVIDRSWAHLGSTNFDERSFDINAEVSLGIPDAGVAAELLAHFEEDLEHAVRIELEAWRRRPRLDRVKEWLCDQLREQI
jgi:cardiolipin synthase A/B